MFEITPLQIQIEQGHESYSQIWIHTFQSRVSKEIGVKIASSHIIPISVITNTVSAEHLPQMWKKHSVIWVPTGTKGRTWDVQAYGYTSWLFFEKESGRKRLTVLFNKVKQKDVLFKDW